MLQVMQSIDGHIGPIPDVEVEWLSLLSRIRKVPASTLGSEISYPDFDFSRFSSVHPGQCRYSGLNWTTTASFHILSSLSFSCYYWMLQSLCH
jgi:hypothetical protein